MEVLAERYKRKYDKALDALMTLRAALDDMSQVDRIAQAAHEHRERLHKTFRDSLVQRFEYTFDITWKCLAEYLEAMGRILEIKTPKAVFREAFKARYLTEDQARLAIQMVDERNLTTHGYNEELIERICANIPAYYGLLKSVLGQIGTAN
jgi:nucleotidyltransferase substrate binding protein (TIGR01987 family)